MDSPDSFKENLISSPVPSEFHLAEKSLVGVAGSLAVLNSATIEQEPAEEAVIIEEPLHEPMKCRLFYTMLFVLMSLNDGLMVGYNTYLVADFTERKVPSIERSLLYVVTIAYFFRMFIGPVTDRYYMPNVGKRKTYLVPCKLITTVLYFIMSFWIDGLVENTKVLNIGLFFFFLSWFMIFENNAMAGFRVDFFGKNESSAAGAATTMSLIGGVGLGMQVFNILNSDKICKEYLGFSGAVMDHAAFFRLIGFINIVGLTIMYFIKEKVSDGSTEFRFSGNPIKVIKSMFGVAKLRNIIIINIIAPTISIGLKVSINQYYWKKGLKKDLHILALSIVLVPMTIASNLIWIKFTKKGNLMYLFWLAITLATATEFFHIFNYKSFKPGENDGRTIIFICILTISDAIGNWPMIQGSLLIRVAPPKYAITFLSSLNSIVAVTRLFPAVTMTAIVDYVNFEWLIVSSLLLQVIVSVATYSTCVDIDKEEPSELGKQFSAKLEAAK